MQVQTTTCQNCKLQFSIEPEDFAFYEKLKVPAPTWCWQCRAMRRMAWRNFRYLYERTCAATGKKIFTIVPPEAPMPPYDRDYWASDAWDPLAYGRDYDFSRPFFEQFRDLLSVVPATNVTSQNTVNSDYGVGMDMKNCYMCFDSGYSEDSAYGVSLQKSKQCFDTINCKSCELCYFVINTTNCYKAFFSRNCTACSDVWFSQDCSGCTNCFGCTGLRGKNYYIFNQPYSKEEYHKKLESFDLGSWKAIQKMRREAEALWLRYPVRFRHGLKDAGCTGDYIFNAVDLRNCFFANGAQNAAHSQSIIYDPIRDVMDITSSGVDIELDYEVSGSGSGIHRTCFVVDSFTTTDVRYAVDCIHLSDSFGCVSLRDKQYCILNKQYSKTEYEALLPKIIEHMNAMPYVDAKGRIYKYGEFFPPEMSPYGYNESQGYEYFAISKIEVEKMGFNWRTPSPRSYAITMSTKDLPDRIAQTDDEILNEVIGCAHDEAGSHPYSCGANCSTALRITAQELQFYRQFDLPLPRTCLNCRHVERIAWRNPPKLYGRKCMCGGAKASEGYKNTASHFHVDSACPNQFETSYAPDRPEIVYCEQCYNTEIA